MRIKFYIVSLLLIFSTKIIFAQSNEYYIKAGFLEKFANFIKWPDEANLKEFTIAIIGDCPFEDILLKMYKDRKIKNLPVQVKHIKTIEDIEGCQMLFISSSEKLNLNRILDYTEHLPILTISESEGFAKKGVHINFYTTAKNTIHFEINPKSVRRSGLKIDALLLNYAAIIE